MTAQQIVIGLDGSHSARQGLDWAAAEADRRSTPLLVVHASDLVDSASPATGAPLSVVTESETYGEQLLAAAAAQVTQRYPLLAVSTMLRHEQPTDVLLQLGQNAVMVVVGTHGDNRAVGALLGSVSQRVAAHATCPVVVIGKDGVVSGDRRVVVAGVSDSPGGTAALRFAFAEAALRGATVLAVRAYGVFGKSEHAAIYGPLPGLRAREAVVLQDAVARMHAEFPDVVVESRLVDRVATDTLPKLAAGADLLVLGCHHPDAHWPSRLGAIASSLLHRSPCPVVVIGLAPAHAVAL